MVLELTWNNIRLFHLFSIRICCVCVFFFFFFVARFSYVYGMFFIYILLFYINCCFADVRNVARNANIECQITCNYLPDQSWRYIIYIVNIAYMYILL